MAKQQASQPPPINTAALIKQLTNSNLRTAQENAALNRINQSGPTGSIDYSRGPNGVWSQKTVLTPAEENLLKGSQQVSNRALNQLTNNPTKLDYNVNGGQLQNSLNLKGVQGIPQADDAAYNKAVDSVYNQATSRLNPQWNQQQTQLQTQLTNEGIPQGSDAWNKAMTQFSQQKNDAYTSAENNAVTQGSQVENNLFNMGLQANQAGISNALTGGNFSNQAQAQGFGQGLQNANLNNSTGFQLANQRLGQAGIGNQYSSPSLPGVAGSQVSPTDVLGANSLASQVALSNYNTATNANSAAKGGIGSLLGTLGSAAIISDKRLKRDIRWVGSLKGVPVYSYRYAWDKRRELGVMAQDIEQRIPSAVIISGGVRRVDYAKIFAQ